MLLIPSPCLYPVAAAWTGFICIVLDYCQEPNLKSGFAKSVGKQYNSFVCYFSNPTEYKWNFLNGVSTSWLNMLTLPCNVYSVCELIIPTNALFIRLQWVIHEYIWLISWRITWKSFFLLVLCFGLWSIPGHKHGICAAGLVYKSLSTSPLFIGSLSKCVQNSIPHSW